jgi:hypothetical protein
MILRKPLISSFLAIGAPNIGSSATAYWRWMFTPLSLLMAASLTLAVPKIEGFLFPVVVDFTITSVEVGHTSFDEEYPTRPIRKTMTIRGNFNKVRGLLFDATKPCDFIAVFAQGREKMGPFSSLSSRKLDVDFRDNKVSNTHTRDLGVQDYGPWVMVFPVETGVKYIDIMAINQCQPMWKVTTTLIENLPVIEN